MADGRGGDGGDGAGRKVGELREALAGLLDPRGVVVLTRERIEEALQDAVSRGRVTADDAQELLSTLLARSLRQTGDLLDELETAVSAKAEKARGAAGRASRPGGAGGDFPIAGYADLTAAEVQDSLDGLSSAQLRRVAEHERANANRKTVLAAVERKLK
ncbi:MAG: hypothetical protein GXY03_02035 [Solirubrobacterales bacterium]|nr:hypothetical protein [Solirubrobacterales bacterium]